MAVRAPREAPFDALERRSIDERHAALAASLSSLIAKARESSAYYGKLFNAIDPLDITDLKALAELPVTRKADLKTIQAHHPPFGGLDTAPQLFSRIFASPGPLFEPEAARPDYWRYARALWATGIRAGDLVHNCFSYHFTPAGAMMETGAHAIGAVVFPGGTGQTDQQAQAAAVLRPTAYTGTPDFLRTIIEHGDSQGLDLTCFRLAHVTAGAFLPDARAFYQSRNIDVLQSYGTAELGLIAYESPAREGLIVDEGAVVEIVEPGTGTPVAEGDVGEVLVTVLNPDYPLIRFATGDLSAMLLGPSPCGRTNRRIKGWLGRADQSTKIKGLFVHPHQVADIVRRHPGIGHVRLIVTREQGADVMTLKVRSSEMDADLARAVETSMHTVTRLKGRVETTPPGSLPRDGCAIEDARDYGV